MCIGDASRLQYTDYEVRVHCDDFEQYMNELMQLGMEEMFKSTESSFIASIGMAVLERDNKKVNELLNLFEHLKRSYKENNGFTT